MRRSVLALAVVAVIAGVALVAGVSGSAGSGEARWLMTDLGTFGGPGSYAVAINERGQVVGQADTKATDYLVGQVLPIQHAFLWEQGKLRDLGATFGGPGSGATAVNERGQVVGAADTKARAKSGHYVTHAFLWQNGSMRDLGTLGDTDTGGGESSYAVDINERGQVIGSSCRDVGNQCRAFLWQKGKMTDLGTLGGTSTEPADINEHGQIVGTATTKGLGTNGSPIQRAFLWQSGKMTDLGTLGGTRSGAVAINERGQVIGWADTTAKSKSGWTTGMPIRHAFLWQNGKMTDLGTLGGEYSVADALNERGQIVGTASTKKTGSHVFLWSNSRMRDLGSFGGPNSEPKAVNKRGQIVGGSDTTATDAKGNPIRHAFLWQNGKMTDLGTRGDGFLDSDAVAINGHNQIIGQTWSSSSHPQHAVLWTLHAL